MASRAPLQLTKARLIIGEGPHDAAFFREIIKVRNLPPADVLSCGDMGLAGNTGFGEALRKIRALPGFNALTDIVIAADTDDDPAVSFDVVVGLIANIPAPVPPEAAHTYPVPAVPHVRAVGSPSITVLMIPWHDRAGALETLCFEAAGRNLAPNVACVDAFQDCAGTGGWPAQKREKMRLRSLLASSYQQKPDIGFGNIWRDAPQLVPVTDPAFDPIADFLAAL